MENSAPASLCNPAVFQPRFGRHQRATTELMENKSSGDTNPPDDPSGPQIARTRNSLEVVAQRELHHAGIRKRASVITEGAEGIQK